MAHVQRRIDEHPGVVAAHAVALRGEFDVVPGREALELRPAHPARGERTGMPTRLELGGGLRDFDPGLRRLVRIEAGGLEGVLVVVENGGRAVEREAQHLPVGRRVVAGDGGHIGPLVELHAGVGHHLADRHDGVLAGHHRRGADFEHLQDVRRVTGTEGGNRRGHRFVVRAFEGRHDLVVFLAGVEILGQVIDPFAQSAPHRVPPLDFGLGLHRHGECRRQGKNGKFHAHDFSLDEQQDAVDDDCDRERSGIPCLLFFCRHRMLTIPAQTVKFCFAIDHESHKNTEITFDHENLTRTTTIRRKSTASSVSHAAPQHAREI